MTMLPSLTILLLIANAAPSRSSMSFGLQAAEVSQKEPQRKVIDTKGDFANALDNCSVDGWVDDDWEQQEQDDNNDMYYSESEDEHFNSLDEHPPHLQASALLQVPCAFQIKEVNPTLKNSNKITPVSAFVDTGAQVTVVSKAACIKAGLLHLLDRRYAGHATGVGQCRVLGRIPANSLQLFLGSSFPPFLGPAITVLESTGTEGVDLLLGLDFLRDHKATLSLDQEEMILGSMDSDTPVVIPFIKPRRYQQAQPLNEDQCDRTGYSEYGISFDSEDSEESDYDEGEEVDMSGV